MLHRRYGNARGSTFGEVEGSKWKMANLQRKPSKVKEFFLHGRFKGKSQFHDISV